MKRYICNTFLQTCSGARHLKEPGTTGGEARHLKEPGTTGGGARHLKEPCTTGGRRMQICTERF